MKSNMSYFNVNRIMIFISACLKLLLKFDLELQENVTMVQVKLTIIFFIILNLIIFVQNDMFSEFVGNTTFNFTATDSIRFISEIVTVFPFSEFSGNTTIRSFFQIEIMIFFCVLGMFREHSVFFCVFRRIWSDE